MLNNKLSLNKDLFSKNVEKISARQGFGDVLVELGNEEDKVVVLCGDLKDSTKTTQFADKFPKRFIEMGIAEQNMASIAAGLALSGKIPFITSFAIFSPGRNWEQIRLSICYSNANVKIIGSHYGLSHCYDGGMAQCLEDIALTRVLPKMMVLCPSDYWEAKKAVRAAAAHNGPVYIRLSRADTPVITSEDSPFEIGKAYVIQEGSDATIISTGDLLFEALLASKELKIKHSVGIEVINCPTIKPLDHDTIIKSAKKTGVVFTLENHQIAGGMGSAICEMLSEKLPTKVIRIGVNDSFGESGTFEELKEKYGLSSDRIIDKVLSEVKKNE